MKLSAPIHRLKAQARSAANQDRIPLHEALDRIAINEGFASWSLLVARNSDKPTAVNKVLAQLNPGDLLLLGARAGHGKTRLSLEVMVERMKLGYRGVFFSLEYNHADILSVFRRLGIEPSTFDHQFEFDDCDDICANYVVKHLSNATPGTLAVIDYLQLLDQKRANPDLMTQVRQLKSFAKQRGVSIIFISQIHRSYDATVNDCPTIKDVRLPNPLDLSLFSKACFLNDEQLRIQTLVGANE